MTIAVQIDPIWVVAMIICGGIGVLVHLLIMIKTCLELKWSTLPLRGKLFTSGYILLFIFSGCACLIWLLFRTDLFITLSVFRCKFIYISNFLLYFIAKYTLHCLLITRIYLTFNRTKYAMPFKSFLLYIILVSFHFFAAMVLWIFQVAPNIQKGRWMQHNICTLFSKHASHILSVNICAISIGVEDFTVGVITLLILLKRLHQLQSNTAAGIFDVDLLQKSIRFAVAASIAMISTVFLFTLAVPFWPNVTFIIAIDVTINSLCIFCVLRVGNTTYHYLCFPFRICEQRYIQNKQNIKSDNDHNIYKLQSLASSTPDSNIVNAADSIIEMVPCKLSAAADKIPAVTSKANICEISIKSKTEADSLRADNNT